MTLEEQVLRAPNPMAALRLLARAVDELRSTPTLDSWDGWVPDTGRAAVVDQPRAPHAAASPESQPVEGSVDRERPRITADDLTPDVVKAWIARNYGRVPEDDVEGRALIAQVRQDLLNAPNVEQVEDLFRTTAEGIIESDIDWTPLNDEHRAARYRFAKQVLNLDVALGDHPEHGDWAADYAQGGPMWLYIPMRDLVMQYPNQVRSQMIQDVQATAHARMSQSVADRITGEFGRDVLKQPMSTDLEGGAPQPVGYREDQL